jgi:hypothetical protein
MSLTQHYEIQFSEGVEYTRKALSEAISKAQSDWSSKEYAQALFYAGYVSFLEDILESFQKTYADYQSLGFTAGTNVAEQTSIAETVMKNAVNPRIGNIYVPRSKGSLSPALDQWEKGLFLTATYMAGRWRSARDWYNSVMMNKFGWAGWRGEASLPFWGDVDPGTGYYA